MSGEIREKFKGPEQAYNHMPIKRWGKEAKLVLRVSGFSALWRVMKRTPGAYDQMTFAS